MTPSRATTLFASLAVAVALMAGCDGDDDGDKGNVKLYCKLSKDLDRKGTQAFAKLEKDPKATEKDYEKVEREFFEQHESEIDEVQVAAPEEISEDVELLVQANRARAGQGKAPDEKKEAAADKRVNEFEKKNC